MPIYAELFTHLFCPKCRFEITQAGNIVLFQWGAIPKGYTMGEEISWDRGLFLKRWVVGDPNLTNVLIIDSGVNLADWSCERCGVLLDKPCIEIRDGKIQNVWLFERGGFERKSNHKQEVSNYFRLGAAGEIAPLPDFDSV